MVKGTETTAIGVVILVFLLASFAFLYAQTEEKISVVTYYPSPYGSYRELEWGNATTGCGGLVNSNGSSVTLGGSFASATPWVEFDRGGGCTPRARIILINDNTLRLDNADSGNINVIINGTLTVTGGINASTCLNYVTNAGSTTYTRCPVNYFAVACGTGDCGAGAGRLTAPTIYTWNSWLTQYGCPTNGYLICVQHT